MSGVRSTRLLAALLTIAAAAAGASAWRDTMVPRLAEVRVPVPGLEREVRILHVSDLHGVTFGERQEGVASALEGHAYDAVALTGDMRSEPYRLAPTQDLLSVIASGVPVIFVQGNHDSGLATDMGLPDALSVPPVRLGGGSVAVTSFLRRSEAATAAVRVILTHVPFPPGDVERLGRETSAATVVLAGHTHGGQVRLPLVGAVVAPADASPYSTAPPWNAVRWFLPELRGRLVLGLRRSGPRAWQHISPGLGTYRLRFRFLDPATVTIVRLVPSERG